MKEVSVRAWCDACATEIADTGGDVEPATAEVVITIGATGRPRLLDLCERHGKALVEPLAALLLDAGQDVPMASQTPTKSRPGTKPALHTAGRFPCLWCPETFAANGGYWGHAVEVHGLPPGSGSTSVYGKRCPSCGVTLGNTTGLGTHGRIAHGAESVAALFRMADTAGDPHGLVARVRKKGRR